MSAKIVSFPTSCPSATKPKVQKADPRLPPVPPRPTRKAKQQQQAARENARENRRKQELLRRWAELDQPLAFDATYRAFYDRLNKMSVDLNLPYMNYEDIEKTFLLMFKDGAMSLRY